MLMLHADTPSSYDIETKLIAMVEATPLVMEIKKIPTAFVQVGVHEAKIILLFLLVLSNHIFTKELISCSCCFLIQIQ